MIQRDSLVADKPIVRQGGCELTEQFKTCAHRKILFFFYFIYLRKRDALGHHVS